MARLLLVGLEHLLGAERVEQLLFSLARHGEIERVNIHGDGIRLRRVRESDKLLLWEWANMPDVRAASFSTGSIAWEQHVRWFANKQNDPNCIFYLALNHTDVPLGQVRFNVSGKDAVISISLDAIYRNRGYGSQIIALATQKLHQISQVQFVHAYVKEENQASLRAFQKAGFYEDDVCLVQGQQARHLTLNLKRML